MEDLAVAEALQMEVQEVVIHLQLVHLKDSQEQLEDHVMDLPVAEEQLILLKQLTTHQGQVVLQDMVAMEQLHLLIQVHVLEQMDQLQEDGLLEEDKDKGDLVVLEADVVVEAGGLL
jgi:hypothetical protein